MTVRLVPERFGINAIMRVNEDDEIRFLESFPHGFQCLIVQAIAHAPRAHDNTRYMGQCVDLLDDIKHR